MHDCFKIFILGGNTILHVTFILWYFKKLQTPGSKVCNVKADLKYWKSIQLVKIWAAMLYSTMTSLQFLQLTWTVQILPFCMRTYYLCNWNRDQLCATPHHMIEELSVPGDIFNLLVPALIIWPLWYSPTATPFQILSGSPGKWEVKS